MKASFSVALVVAVVALIAISDALPAKKRIVYYQQPAAAASLVATPHRMMYLQYVQPARGHARSHHAAAALVAGDSVTTGTYLKDCDHPESDSASGESQQQDVSSVAEAYPASAEEEEETIPAGELPLANDDDAKVPRDYRFDQPEDVAVEAEPAFVANLPAPKPIAPIATPTKTYLPPAAPKRKVIVELEQAADEEGGDDLAGEYDAESSVAASEEQTAEEEDEVAEQDDDSAEVVPVAPKKPARRIPAARRPAAPKKPAAKPKAKAPACVTCAKAKNPAPQGTFFPIDFGGTNGGAIAIANSFSTGEGGSATSHAIAYGSPNPASRSRHNASKRH